MKYKIIRWDNGKDLVTDHEDLDYYEVVEVFTNVMKVEENKVRMLGQIKYRIH